MIDPPAFTPPRPGHAGADERRVTSNLWAFLHWLAWAHEVRLLDWDTLCDWATANRTAFAACMTAFAGAESPGQGPTGLGPATLAGLLLHADLRPGDRVVLAGGRAAAGWQSAARFATTLIATDPLPEALWNEAAQVEASVLIAPARLIDRAAFALPRRAALGALRLIIALDGPPSAGARRRVLTWVKPDVLLLARRGALAWGSPLDPTPDNEEWAPRRLPGAG